MASRYKPEYVNQARIACRLGAIDTDLAELFSVSFKTIYTWRSKYPDFAEACAEGKDDANEKVKQALFNRATGCTVRDDKVFNNNGEALVVEGFKEYPPDTGACMAWLYNRDRDNWKKDPALIDGDKGEDSNVYNITIVKPDDVPNNCLLYTSPSPRDGLLARMPSSA